MQPKSTRVVKLLWPRTRINRNDGIGCACRQQHLEWVERQTGDRSDSLPQEVIVVPDRCGGFAGVVLVNVNDLVSARARRQQWSVRVHRQSAYSKT